MFLSYYIRVTLWLHFDPTKKEAVIFTDLPRLPALYGFYSHDAVIGQDSNEFHPTAYFYLYATHCGSLFNVSILKLKSLTDAESIFP